jgi:hypothetical protein
MIVHHEIERIKGEVLVKVYLEGQRSINSKEIRGSK